MPRSRVCREAGEASWRTLSSSKLLILVVSVLSRPPRGLRRRQWPEFSLTRKCAPQHTAASAGSRHVDCENASAGSTRRMETGRVLNFFSQSRCVPARWLYCGGRLLWLAQGVAVSPQLGAIAQVT